MYYYYSYFNLAIPMLNGNANKDCCCCMMKPMIFRAKIATLKRGEGVYR